MGSNLNVGSFQVALGKELVKQAVEPPGKTPGLENPQISSVAVRAMKGNAGVLYLGSEESATAAAGFELAAGDAVTVDVLGLGDLWFNGTKTGDKLCVFWTGP